MTYWIDGDVWGRGIATEALGQFLATVSTDRPIYARCADDNRASARVLEKNGFVMIADERGYANARGAEIEETVWRLGMPWRFGERRVASIGANLQDIARAAAGDDAPEAVRTQYTELAIEQATGRTIVVDPWTLGAFNERHQARLAHHRAVLQGVKLATGIGLVCSGCLLMLVVPNNPWGLAIIGLFVVGVLIAVTRLTGRFTRRATRRTLREYGVPICVRCSYIGDNPSGTGLGPLDPCPECGMVPRIAIGARLGPEEPGFGMASFVASGGDPNQQYDGGQTLLMLMGKFEFQPLLDAGADATAIDDEGRGVLHHVAAADLQGIRTILKAGADPTLIANNGQSVLDAVIEDHQTASMCRVLYQAGARPNLWASDGRTPLHAAATSQLGSGRAVAQLINFWIEVGVDPNSTDPAGETPLALAIRYHAEQSLEGDVSDPHSDEHAIALLRHGVDPNVRIARGVPGVLRDGATPLMVGRYQDSRLVRALLDSGADPHATCPDGRSALDEARAARDASRGAPGFDAIDEIVRFLEAGPGVRSAD